MAYATSRLHLLVSGIGSSPSLWVYRSDEAHGTVDGTDYFTDAKERGMKAGDVVINVFETGFLGTLHAVAEVDSDGNATLSAAVLS